MEFSSTVHLGIYVGETAMPLKITARLVAVALTSSSFFYDTPTDWVSQ
jgi:hypothetical protein